MTLLKTRTFVTCPKTGKEVNINAEDGCRYCSFLGPVSGWGKTQLVLACRYVEPDADAAEKARRPAAIDRDPADPGVGQARL